MFNLRNRSFLKEIDFEPTELRSPPPAVGGRQDRQVRRHRGEAPRGQGDRPDLREDVDPHPLGLRGRRLRPGRARHLSRSVGLAARPQGVGGRHGPRARPHVRRHRVPRQPPGRRRGAGRARRGARLQRAHQRVASRPRCWPTSSRCTRRAASRTTRSSYAFVGDCRFNMGRSLLVMGALMGADVRLAGPAEPAPPGDVVAIAEDIARRTGARITITDDASSAVIGRRLHPHRRVGVDGRGQGRVDRAGPAARAVPGELGAAGEDGQPEGQVHALPARLPRSEHRSSVGR